MSGSLAHPVVHRPRCDALSRMSTVPAGEPLRRQTLAAAVRTSVRAAAVAGRLRAPAPASAVGALLALDVLAVIWLAGRCALGLTEQLASDIAALLVLVPVMGALVGLRVVLRQE